MAAGEEMMEELGAYRELSSTGRALGALVFVGMLAMTAGLERAQFKLRETEATTWWASSGRDALNALAVAVMMLGLRLLGFNGPVGLALAATLLILISALQPSFEKRTAPTALSIGVALALGLPVLLAPAEVHSAVRQLLGALFP